MNNELQGRVCLVTGSTRGIGKAIAERFAREGAQVVVLGRDAETARTVADALPGPAFGIGAELGEPAADQAVVEEILNRTGRLDALVNNAAVARDRYLTRLTDEDWDVSMRTNAAAPFHLMRACVPAMKENRLGGVILNVISWAGLRGRPGQAAYAASKGALIALTLTAAKELGRFGIRVNALSPVADTDMNAAVSQEDRAKALDQIVLGRLGTVEEAAEAALFLVSDRSRYTTGQILHVDGGLHLT